VNAKGGRPAKLGLTGLVACGVCGACGRTSRSSMRWTTIFVGLGALQGRTKKATGIDHGGEKAAALSLQVPVAAPLGAVSKFPPGFGPTGPGPGAAHGSGALEMLL
jgi:hypothetical protein